MSVGDEVASVFQLTDSKVPYDHVTHVRKENTYAARRTGVLCVDGNSSVGKRSAASWYASKFDSAPSPDPPSNPNIPSSHLL